MIVSEAARPTIDDYSMRSGAKARPVMASNASVVSMMTMPATIPTTAVRAAFSFLA